MSITVTDMPTIAPSKTLASLPTATIVTCVEYGPLEIMVVRMVDSLRRWGGRLADAPVYAVKPRRGMPLTRETRRRFDELNVHFLDIKPKTPYAWFRFLNKPIAVMAVEEKATTEQITWLDADLVITREPTDLFLRPGEDFVACASDKNVGSTGSGDEFEPFWQAISPVFGRPADQLPWVIDERTGNPVRLYFNAGIFSYRRSTGYARTYYDGTLRLLEARVALKQHGVVFHDQLALGLAMLERGMTYRAMGDWCNRPVGKILDHDREKFRNAAILHYHGCMWPDFWPKFLEYLQADHPVVYDWLKPQGPVSYTPSLPVKTMKKVLDAYRKRQSDAFEATCRRF